MVSAEVIESFLHGSDPQKYIVAIEAVYFSKPEVSIVINDPENGKRIETHPFHPFLWFKEEITRVVYNGNRQRIIEASQKYGIKIKKLRTHDDMGNIPERMEKGYKFMAICKKSYNDLINFFREGGIDIRSEEFKPYFVIFSPVEQYMIQSGKRLFKGIDDYDGVHRLQFDIETEGLVASKDPIFQIGIRDNRGFEHILETTGNTPQELRDSERENLKTLFKIIDIIKPDIISGYNSESFDWPYFVKRCQILHIPLEDIAITLDPYFKIKRKPSMIKFGSEVENYDQTNMFGYNIIDISHSVRRAMAINSNIQSWSLKYVTKYSGIAKPNRVYVPGGRINTIWADKINKYAFNDKNGDWYVISDKRPIKDDYKEVEGSYIVQRYLLDDLWETEKVDTIFNQATFLIAKMLPTSYQRSSTMGTASQWKLIMSAWSYENELAIPATQEMRDFTGGLSRLLYVGYSKNVVKLDYAALYPKTELTHDIFPDLDITGVMKGLLTYVVDTRDRFKFLTEEAKGDVKALEKKIKENETLELIEELTNKKSLVGLYDKKQLPLKILANSWFGSYGASYLFNWGDVDCAEETTCCGRMYLRLMVRYFCDKYGYKPLVGDSVTYDTPVYIRYKENGYFDIKPICDVFNEKSEFLIDELRDFEEKAFEVLTVNGWKEIKYVYRHSTDKKIHKITTKNRLVQVTEDHSLFQNQKQIKPSSLKRNEPIDVCQLPSFNALEDITDTGMAWLYGFFLGDGSSNSGTRNVHYKSKKSGLVTYKVKRSDWKISNARINLLERLQQILKNNYHEGLIKDHIKSSSVFNLVVHDAKFAKFFSDNFYTSYREKKVPSFILNSNLEIKKAFIEGVCASDGYGDTIDTCSGVGMKSQVAMAGISYLLSELGIEYKIKTRKDKENFNYFSLKNDNRSNSSFTSKTIKKPNLVWKNEVVKNKDKNSFVYDISTEDGTFIGGIGGINLKNTDGFNFEVPDGIESVKYTAKGTHWKTVKNKGVELSGTEAILAEFNETLMRGRMGLDIDDVFNSTINFSRKNYANLLGNKVKLVGNSIKSKKMPTYIEEFLNKGIRMLLDGKGYDFIEAYYEYVNKIYNYQIPLVKIASKSKVKLTLSDYRKKGKQKNKAGNPMPKQAHMELALKENLDVSLGDVIYYVNTGSSKSQGDIKTVNDKKTGKTTTEINCKLISPQTVESDFDSIKELEDLKKILEGEDISEALSIETKNRIEEIELSLATDEYNVAKYIFNFNKKIEPLLVCFGREIRGKILIKTFREKKTKIFKLQPRSVFTRQQCELKGGEPDVESDQDKYEEIMTMEDKEIRFWLRAERVPITMNITEWKEIKNDYFYRMECLKKEGIANEKNLILDAIKRLEISEINEIKTKGTLPINIFRIADIDASGEPYLVSRQWSERLCHVDSLFGYEDEAIDREKFYTENGCRDKDNRYEMWVAQKAEELTMDGTTTNYDIKPENDFTELSKLIKEVNKDLIVEEFKDAEIEEVKEDDPDLESDVEEDEIVSLEEEDEWNF